MQLIRIFSPAFCCSIPPPALRRGSRLSGCQVCWHIPCPSFRAATPSSALPAPVDPCRLSGCQNRLFHKAVLFARLSGPSEFPHGFERGVDFPRFLVALSAIDDVFPVSPGCPQHVPAVSGRGSSPGASAVWPSGLYRPAGTAASASLRGVGLSSASAHGVEEGRRWPELNRQGSSLTAGSALFRRSAALRAISDHGPGGEGLAALAAPGFREEPASG